MTDEKPLFVPLKSNWYFAYEHRLKDHEIRMYGPRYNERTCRVGRAITLSRGYGKANRLKGEISSFEKLASFRDLPQPYRDQFVDVFGEREGEIAYIGITLKS